MSANDSSGSIEWRYVADAAQLQAAAASLGGAGIVGLDTETYWDVKTGRQQVSLVQVAPPDGPVLVADVLAAGVEPLRPLLESPDVKMIAHNARFDEAVLREAGIRAGGLIDTLRMSRMALTLGSHSLASLSEHLFGLPLDKSFQKSNWRRRPLTRAQIEYAALDARIVLQVYEELRRLLDEQGRLEVALRASEIAPAESAGPRRARKKRTASVPEILLTPEEKRVVACLKKWRLERANAGRVPAYMICADRTLEHLARAQPATLEALAAIYGLGESKIKNFGEELLQALRDASA
ncbi:MAG TPA: HRDC domain-containing protein [Pyrinomonadaceae bacterium]|nr:HRDC domain-containing protein [Pyrinomonadaceae bacterium]